MLHACIMAGGSGTRFWPVSREAHPKQMLSLLGDRSLLQTTADRLAGLVASERVMVATSETLASDVREQLPELAAEAILAEPCRRDTAPCIGLAALLVAQRDPQATMLVLPADHVIRDTAAFTAAVRQAVALVDDAPQRLVTFGVRPTYAAESFGYLERGEPLPSGAADASAAYRVRRFREKPSADVAREYLASGNFYWNAGIFVWRAATISEQLAACEPAMFERLRAIAAAHGSAEFQAVFRREFAAIRGVSIDYAVMERAAEVVLIEAPFDWDDLGSWQALARLRGADELGNTRVGRSLAIDTRGTIIYGDARHLVVTVGLDDFLVVHTADATLVAPKGREEALRQIVKEIEQQGSREFL